MSTVHFRNAVILFRGVDMSGFHNELGVEYAAESLDDTVFGDTTRSHKGGLTTVRVTGRGYVEYGADLPDPTYFDRVGTDDDVLTVFPDGVTVGSTTNRGFACKVMTAQVNQGGAVGTLLPFDLAFEGRGIEGAA